METTLRVRVRMDDGPGSLARIAIRLADLRCNILGLTVLPVPGGVLDEMVIRPAPGVTRAEVLDAIRAEGGTCAGVADADLHQLVDPPASALDAAAHAVGRPARHCDALRTVLTADLVTTVPSGEANPGRTEGGHRAVFPSGDGTAFVARRRWAPFVEQEIARGEALLRLLGAVRRDITGPSVVTCADGATVVLRTGVPADADAVAALHARCSANTLFNRYHTGVRTIPRRWLHRLLVPPRGRSLLAVCGRDVVALGQLIPAGDGSAEVSLLVEDRWQRNGLGTAVLARVAELANADGHGELVALCLTGQDAVRRTAVRAGLAVGEPERDGSVARLRITLSAAPRTSPSPWSA
ncbi:GNAT family N-acetyltransferase [Amycolatopsis suaedae]|uniref:GNAT family N-acetyltransferase n=1 Tax=Amycolatopsis suaedae TaxID=2510978 RepID=A0A4Q7J0A6_9PSEU|nr:GNAT family N-acetyltransferase [Amycolatopsis suaedae]RZQ59972.1 GNAT family N-acetyltransferase [Amycolatopsis suaedae]